MGKEEYLCALKEALKDTDKSVMEEIISDYEEHFLVGMENGKSEEQICEDLGPIESLAEEIKEAYTDSKEDKRSKEDTDSKHVKFKDWYTNIHNIDGEKIGDVINSALDTAGDAISKIDVNEIGRTVKNTLDQATSSITNFADSYLKGTGAFDFSRKDAPGYKENVSKSYDVTSEEEEKSSETAQADTQDSASSSEAGSDESTNSSLHTDDGTAGANAAGEAAEAGEETVNAGNGSEAGTDNTDEKKEEAEDTNKVLDLVIDGICADVHVQKSSDGKLNLNYENNGNEKQKEMYEFYSYKEGNTVYAGIRRSGKAATLFNIRTYSIHIYVEVPEQMGNVNIKTASGSIELSDIESERVTAVAASGDVTASYMKVKYLSLKSSSGNVAARYITAEIVDNSSLSGDLEIVNLKASECKIRTISGSISINDFTVNNADVGSTSGGVKLSQVIGDGLRVTSTSGSVSADINVKRCHASSKSGNIEVRCSGDIKLESNSISGGVNITLKNYGNGYSICSKTVSGTLGINYDNKHQRNLRTGTYTYGNQGSEMNLSSVSGNIHVSDW